MSSQKYSSKKRKVEIGDTLSSMKEARSVFKKSDISYDNSEWKKVVKALKAEKKNLKQFNDTYMFVTFLKTISIKGTEITFEIESTGEYIVDINEKIWLKCRNPKTESPHNVRMNKDLTIDGQWLKNVGIELIEEDNDDGYSFQDRMRDFTDAFFEEAKEDGWYWNMD